MAAFSFETSNAPKRENSFELMPAGFYTAQITESEIVDLKSGLGQALKLTFEVLQDGYRNRKVWARLNVRHTGSPAAEQIAQEQLRELCEAIGVVRMSDTTELHNKPVSIRVKIREDKSGQYEAQNEVVGFKAAAGGSSHGFAIPPSSPRSFPASAANMASANTAAASAPGTAAPAAISPPWAKKTA
jgi:hypothetical protein